MQSQSTFGYNRWRVVVIRPDGSPGVSYFCRTDAEKVLISATLERNGRAFVVEAYAVLAVAA